MRLIDADSLKEWFNVDPLDELSGADILVGIDMAKTIELAPVVRCKDCSKNATAECAMSNVYKPGKWHAWNGEDDFCSWGSREGEK